MAVHHAGMEPQPVAPTAQLGVDGLDDRRRQLGGDVVGGEVDHDGRL
jgi:hypothetical protein